jgi:hypothetical protein
MIYKKKYDENIDTSGILVKKDKTKQHSVQFFFNNRRINDRIPYYVIESHKWSFGYIFNKYLVTNKNIHEYSSMFLLEHRNNFVYYDKTVRRWNFIRNKTI